MITVDQLLGASRDGDFGVVKQYIQEGGDINTKDEHDWTALMYVSYYGHLEIVEYLVGVGADIDIKNNEGDTALMYASKNHHYRVVELLEDMNGYLLRKGIGIEDVSDMVSSCII